MTVDEDGLITAAGDVPEEGKAVYVTAYAGSGNDTVKAQCKVIVGNYNGERTVGRLTINARTINKDEFIPHSAVTFTSYEDIDLDISYYHYYRPTEAYKALMEDYRDHPEKYKSDPALCNDNELGLTDRESYFDDLSNDPNSDPATVSLESGESISVSNYSFDPTYYHTFMGTIIYGTIINTSAEAQEFAKQVQLYMSGDEAFDGVSAFDSTLGTIMYMYGFAKKMGYNPADGHTDGGMIINREMYNQFRRNDSQMPNNYYTIEITADELAMMRAYLADPDNNYYSLFVKNCASGALDLWNATLADKPELQIQAGITGLGMDPQSVYFKLGQMTLNKGLDGEGGVNFYPRTVAYKILKVLTETTAERAEGKIAVISALKENLRGRSVNIGLYDKDGGLIEARTVTEDSISENVATAALNDNSEAAYIKVFVWDSMASIEPIGGVEQVPVN